MRYLSLFSGIGAPEIPLQELGHKCVGYSEIDKYAIEIYQKHFPKHKNYGDITTVEAKDLPDFDFLIGGFPCQSFSIAGKRRGFDDTRGTLFFEIARVLEAKRPRLLLLENVKGLLSHQGGKTFATIICALDELGYDLQWQVLNSKDFGVPQNRERVFIVGHLRGTTRPEVFPIGEGSGDALPGDKEGEERIAGTITTRYGDGTGRGTHIEQVNQPVHSNDRVYKASGIAPTLNTAQGGRRQPKILAVNQRREVREMSVAGAVPASPSSSQGSFVDQPSVRRLTPLECERLQGFPDGWTEGVSDTQRYKVLGNAMTVNTVGHVIRRILQ